MSWHAFIVKVHSQFATSLDAVLLAATKEKANLIMYCKLCRVYATIFHCYMLHIVDVCRNILYSIILVTCPVIQYL